MIKRITAIIILIIAAFAALIGSSYLYTYYKEQTIYEQSPIHTDNIKDSDVIDFLKEAGDQTAYFLIYDNENPDCIYVDQVILNEIANEYQIQFDMIHRIIVKNTDSLYSRQKILNKYSIDTIPALVKVQLQGETILMLDKTSYQYSIPDDKAEVRSFLVRNGIIEK